MANWDGIAHRGGRFVHFIPLGGLTDRNRAIEAARAEPRHGKTAGQTDRQIGQTDLGNGQS
jgi:hypothetical protein